MVPAEVARVLLVTLPQVQVVLATVFMLYQFSKGSLRYLRWLLADIVE